MAPPANAAQVRMRLYKEGKFLSLSNDQLGLEGARVLAATLKELSVLEELLLNNCNLGDDGVMVLAGALKTCKTIRKLSLNYNGIGPAGARPLAAALKFCPSLVDLDLTFNSLGDKGAQAIAAGFKDCPSLEYIYLGENWIGDEGVQSVVAALKGCPWVKQFSLFGNKVTDAGAKVLAASLKDFLSIEGVVLRTNQIGDEGAKAILAALPDCPSLEFVTVADNKCNEALVKQLQSGDAMAKIADRDSKVKANQAKVAAARKEALEDAAKAAKANAAISDDWQLSRGEVTLTKELGRGKSGYVFLASYNGVKVLAQEAAGALDAAKKKEFEQDAELMKKVCNPPHVNVLLFYGACIDDRGVLVVTERAQLGVLSAYLVANPKIPGYVRLAICTQVAAALGHLHACKPTILHKYLSARNVVLVAGADKGSVVAKVTGFGLARRMPREADDFEIPPRRTAAMDRWAAPEVLSANTYYKASDVWSFGVLAWEVYSMGALPYGTAVADDDIAEGVNNKTLTLAQPEACPAPQWALLKPCLTYQAHNRPAFGALFKQLAALKP